MQTEVVTEHAFVGAIHWARVGIRGKDGLGDGICMPTCLHVLERRVQ